jgi:predicted permease
MSDEIGLKFLSNVTQDVRIGARTLLKTPIFSIFATLVLSIGIGANVIVFAYVNALFFKPLHAPEPERLVKIYGTEGGDAPIGMVSYSTYAEYRDRNGAFADLGMSYPGASTPIRTEGPGTRPVDIAQLTFANSALFRSINAGVVLGRGIEPLDEKAGAPSVVVINEQAARQYFPGERSVLRRILYIDNSPRIIVGVVSEAFEDVLSMFPVTASPRLYLPAMQSIVYNYQPPVFVIGRLRRGVSRMAAQSDLEPLAAKIAADRKIRVGVSVERANFPPSWLWVGLASLVALFLVVVLVVLLIACDDIAIMLLARVAARRREMGIRMALGAGRRQLIVQLIAENSLLALAGGSGAMIFTLLSARALDSLGLSLPEAFRVTFNWRVLAFTTGISFATTLFFGLRPALECVGRSVVASLTPGAAEPGQRSARVRSSLIITQITICTALLVTTAAVARNSIKVSFADRGFKADHVLLSRVNFAGSGYRSDRQLTFYRSLLDRLSNSPGIEAACVVDSLPVELPGGDYFRFGGTMAPDVAHSDSGKPDLQILTNVVSPGNFATLHIPMIFCRDFRPQDDASSAAVAIVSRTLAAQLWPNENPVGRTVRLSDATTVEIVGVSGDIQYRTRFDDSPSFTPVLYRPLNQLSSKTVPYTIMIRSTGVPLKAAGILERRINEIDPNLLAFNTRPLDEQLDRALLPFRVIGYAIGLPGVFVLLLGVIGTYGTMAIVVTQRRREVGIRVALGAHPASATRLIVKEGLRATAIGVGLGIVGAVMIGVWLSRNVSGPSFFDPVAFAAPVVLVSVIAGIASYIPARRASRIDPMIVLRED